VKQVNQILFEERSHRRWPTTEANVTTPGGLLCDVERPTGLFTNEMEGGAARKLKGPVVDQASISPDVANFSYQENAYRAIGRFLAR